MHQEKFRGVIAPLLTPFENDGSIALDLYDRHAKRILEAGAHYLSPFGTTGEATSVSLAERTMVLDNLINETGVAPDKIMPGAGLCNLPETVALTKHAVEKGCKAVMLLPPFFYSQASDDGIFNYVSAVINAVADSRLKICLYHIPQNTVVGYSPELAARLNTAFPDTVVAYKDSSGNFENTRAVLEKAPALSVFPGSESLMRAGMELGGAGCISATLNLNAAAIRRLFDLCEAGGADIEEQDKAIKQFRTVVQNAGLIEGMKACLAYTDNDPRWLNVRPPLVPKSIEDGQAIQEQLQAIG